MARKARLCAHRSFTLRCMSGRRLPRLPWLSRGVVAGAAGTAAMATLVSPWSAWSAGTDIPARTLTDGTTVEGLWSQVGLDYDDSMVPGQIVASLLGLDQPTRSETRANYAALDVRFGFRIGSCLVAQQNP